MPKKAKTEKCQICKKPVQVMCQKGTGFCSQKCEKASKA